MTFNTAPFIYLTKETICIKVADMILYYLIHISNHNMINRGISGFATDCHEVPWVNYLPSVSWYPFWKPSCKWQLVLPYCLTHRPTQTQTHRHRHRFHYLYANVFAYILMISHNIITPCFICALFSQLKLFMPSSTVLSFPIDSPDVFYQSYPLMYKQFL